MKAQLSVPEKIVHHCKDGIHIFVNPYSGGNFVTDDAGAKAIDLMRHVQDEERLIDLVAEQIGINPFEAAARLLAFTDRLKGRRMLAEAGKREDAIPQPQTGFLEITRKCDTRCRLCYVNSGEERPDTLSKEEIFATVDQMAEMGIEFIALSGGDPLTRGDMLPILRHINKTHGLTAGLSTSLLSLTEETAQEMGELSVLVQVSLDGSSSEINDWNRGEGTFDKAMNGIRLLNKYEVPFRFACVINKHNIEDVENMVDLALQLGAREIAFAKVRIAGRAERQRQAVCPNSEAMAVAYHKLYRKHVKTRHTGMKIRCKVNQVLLSGLDDRVGCLPCGAGRTFIQVSHNGNIVPCSLLSGEQDFYLGNVRSDKLTDVWRNSRVYGFFRGTTADDIGVCAPCPVKNFCGGGCRADAYLSGGGLHARCDDCGDLLYYYEWMLSRGCQDKYVTTF